jgi:proline dehydrogenase
MTDFENTEIAFKHRTDKELKKARILFKFMEYPMMVRAAGVIANLGIGMRLPVGWLVRPTVFSHFCGGESLPESRVLVEFIAGFGVHSVLDFAAENKESENEIQGVINEIIRTMDFAVGNPFVNFSVFKPSALAPLAVLAKAGSPEKEGSAGIEKFRNNIKTLCHAASQRGVPVMVDAEESHYQHIVDAVVTEMMETYNRERCIVYNTLQMYRHDRLEFLDNSLRAAREKNYKLGLKLVRGAYMDQERDRAHRMGYPSPIYPDKKSTDDAFNEAVNRCLQNIETVNIFIGTHNEESLLLLMEKMRQHSLKNNDPRIQVSQLYGMSDHISFNMAHESYNVVKYLPYGPVHYLLPYLIRRVEENKSVTGQSGRELHFINLEIERRKNHQKHNNDNR